jgi:hypothetical protein
MTEENSRQSKVAKSFMALQSLSVVAAASALPQKMGRAGLVAELGQHKKAIWEVGSETIH